MKHTSCVQYIFSPISVTVFEKIKQNGAYETIVNPLTPRGHYMYHLL
jgi:hypothetical protein